MARKSFMRMSRRNRKLRRSRRIRGGTNDDEINYIVDKLEIRDPQFRTVLTERFTNNEDDFITKYQSINKNDINVLYQFCRNLKIIDEAYDRYTTERNSNYADDEI